MYGRSSSENLNAGGRGKGGMYQKIIIPVARHGGGNRKVDATVRFRCAGFPGLFGRDFLDCVWIQAGFVLVLTFDSAGLFCFSRLRKVVSRVEQPGIGLTCPQCSAVQCDKRGPQICEWAVARLAQVDGSCRLSWPAGQGGNGQRRECDVSKAPPQKW